ncbi:hypothetical protein JCM8097_009035 [Rhodosporidiobolus ruineniae]
MARLPRLRAFAGRWPVLTASLVVGTPYFSYKAYTRVKELEERYPFHQPAPDSTLLTLAPPGTRTEDVGFVSAVVPFDWFVYPGQRDWNWISDKNYADAFAVAFFSIPQEIGRFAVFSLLLGMHPLWPLKYNVGESLFRDGHKLPGGLDLRVVEPPTMVRVREKDDTGAEQDVALARITVEWESPPGAVRFFERLARLGYPFRLMSGGRHTLEVKPLFSPFPPANATTRPDHNQPSRRSPDKLVEVRFGCAHDYARTGGADGADGADDDGKKIPAWVSWAHQMYARWLLDKAVSVMESYNHLVEGIWYGNGWCTGDGGLNRKEVKRHEREIWEGMLRTHRQGKSKVVEA